MEPRDQLVMLNGLRFHYREWGQPGAPPLVLLHGFGAHARLWDTFARAVVEDFHIFALDQRGHGETDWAPAFSLDELVEDLAHFVDGLQFASVTLLGHSMGGGVAWQYAAQPPARVQRLVDLAAPLLPADPADSPSAAPPRLLDDQ